MGFNDNQQLPNRRVNVLVQLKTDLKKIVSRSMIYERVGEVNDDELSCLEALTERDERRIEPVFRFLKQERLKLTWPKI